MNVWDVDIHSDNHIHLRNRLAKTGVLERAGLFLPFGENGGPIENRFVLFLSAEQRAGDNGDLWRSRLRRG
jgi:hypothetical protein